jgi:alcohol dehydrogenase (NADP+)
MTMEKTHTFANGDRMQLLGLGTWKSEPGDVGKAVREAIRIGYRHIDCAAFYGNEAEVGVALREAMRAGEVTRKELWITSKLWCNAHGKKNVAPAIKKSLSDFGLDHLDMYLVHWPVALKPSAVFPNAGTDFATAAEAPMQDTWAAMETVRAEGLTRHIGVSNFSAKKLADLVAHAKVKPEVNQIELHPFLQQKALVDYCTSQGIHVTAYSSLGSGDRPAFLKAATDPVPLEDPIIASIAEAHACTRAQVLLAWHLHRGISTLAKSINPARLRENFAATEVQLTKADLEEIAALDRGFRFIAGAFWAMPGSPWTLETLWDEPQKT